MKKIIVLLFAAAMAVSCKTDETAQKMEETKKEAVEEVYNYEGEALKVAIDGLTHTHVHWILGREDFGDIELVGIAEPNRDLAERFCDHHKISRDLIYPNLEALLAEKQPEAVLAYNSIEEHMGTVELCAPKGIHVMVEKPLAVNVEHADRMVKLAKENNIELLTNYETTWYGSTHDAYKIVNEQEKIGKLRKMVFHTGHYGPVEIGCNKEFLDWLCDPVKNGGGALVDFGCYGANIATWMMNGTTPTTVTAITKQIKPDIYPNVDDDALIILNYDGTEIIIQASWNWPHNVKDMELYGQEGVLKCINHEEMVLMEGIQKDKVDTMAAPLAKGYHDPFAYFAHVLKKGHQEAPYGLNSLENNEIVVKILEAAKVSAATGESVEWEEMYAKK